MINFALVPEHGWCVAATFFLVPLNLYGIYQVVSARKKYNVKYPALYADKDNKNAKEFNCAQRAHQNFLEQVPLQILVSAVGSVLRPSVAVWAISARMLGLFLYIHGYSKGSPEKRTPGFVIGIAAFWVLLGLSIEVAYRMST